MKNKIICKSFIIFGSLFLIAVLFTSYIMAYNKNVLPNNQLKEINKSASGFSYQWGLYNQGQVINEKKGEKGIDINILKAWEITKGSSDVIVGMLDSGIELDNIEISDSIYYNKNEILNNIDDDHNGYVDDVNGWNFYRDNNILFDSYLHDYHGTYLSGIIVASHNICGVAPNVKILPLKFMSGSQGQTKDAIKAIEYAYNFGVRIINCSWDNTTYDEDIESIMEKYSDILFVCSAGKQGTDLARVPVYPACYDLPNVISVAAIDNQGNLYTLSGYGEKAQVAAPGVDIYSCMPDGDYTYSSGTSPATAYVTGVAALVKSYRPELSAIQIAKILKENCKTIDSLKSKIALGGIIDAYKCLKSAEKF